MVQITKESMFRKKARALRRGVFGFLRVVLLSAAIPLLFLTRYWWTHTPLLHDGTLEDKTTKQNLRTPSEGEQKPLPIFEFLETIDMTSTHGLLGSDQAELYHCNVQAVDLANFTAWASPILNSTVAEILKTERKAFEEVPNSVSMVQEMEQEFIVELLEISASAQGLCDYQRYKPTVPPTAMGLNQAVSTLLKIQDVDTPPMAARLAICIVAYQDLAQLQRLVNGVHMPHHYIIIHLERRTDPEYEQQVQNMASKYENVIVLKFGTIVYKTDSVSLIHLRIMRWLVEDMRLHFDYYLTLDGSTFPLQTAEDLAMSLLEANRPVWIGEMTDKGRRVHTPQYNFFLVQKSLVSTRDGLPKLMKRLPKTALSDVSFSDAIVSNMVSKSVSGNTAIFSYDTVSKLLGSSDVMELFALSKYGCCCCLEERNWIAALSMIGLKDEAQEQASMWQVWGGKEECGSSMNNAVLNRNASICFRLEDGTLESPPLYIYGNETMDYLIDASARGFFFARKFRSDDEQSMALLRDIESELHNKWRE